MRFSLLPRPSPGGGPSGQGRDPLVVMLSAGMGAGHDHVADELSRRLRQRGFDVETVDVWTMLPAGLGRAIAAFYKMMILHAPWLYRAIYWTWFRPRGKAATTVSPLVYLAGRRLGRRLAARPPRLVVCTFHVGAQVAGWLRRTGRLDAPVASMVVDFAAHRLWVAEGVDAHLCLHPLQADAVRAQGGRGAVAVGPVVRPAFAPPRGGRQETRRRVGRRPGEGAVLVVAGSWGAGDVESTAKIISCTQQYLPVAVAGRNAKLARRLAGVRGAAAHGWVEDMERLVAAADVVVENAGGLTAMEAIALGVPVVSFRPIAGHGRDNVEAMARAGISAYAADEAELLSWLDQLSADTPARRRLTKTGRAMFAGDDPADVLAGLAGGTGARPEQRAASSAGD